MLLLRLRSRPNSPRRVDWAGLDSTTGLPDVITYAIYAGANGGNSTAVNGFLPLLYAYGGSMTDETGKWIIDSCPIRSTLSYYATAYWLLLWPSERLAAGLRARLLVGRFAGS